MNDSPAITLAIPRPVRFLPSEAGTGPVIVDANNRELIRLTKAEFCDMLRDLELDPDLERALRCMLPSTPDIRPTTGV